MLLGGSAPRSLHSSYPHMAPPPPCTQSSFLLPAPAFCSDFCPLACTALSGRAGPPTLTASLGEQPQRLWLAPFLIWLQQIVESWCLTELLFTGLHPGITPWVCRERRCQKDLLEMCSLFIMEMLWETFSISSKCFLFGNVRKFFFQASLPGKNSLSETTG